MGENHRLSVRPSARPYGAASVLASPAELRLQVTGRQSVDRATSSESRAEGAGWARDGSFDLAPSLFESASWINRSAICAEPRNGILYIFMPPVESLEDYLGLVAAMEATAEGCAKPFCLKATNHHATRG